MEQIINDGNYNELGTYLSKYNKVFIVCSKSFEKLNIGSYINSLPIEKVFFRDFSPNPTYESVVLGIKAYRESNAPLIMAVGGGSAIDVAKCIKLYAMLKDSDDYLKEDPKPNDIDLMAIPTTAGTGSEATRFAVIYKNGVKQSVHSEEILPGMVVLDSSTLETLPMYQRKATMLDAFSHAIEAYWSVNATDLSKKYSSDAIQIIVESMDEYLRNTKEGNAKMLLAANIAGKAINIAKTTAGHALSYKLTSLYGIAHGHAAMLANATLYPYMIAKGDDNLKNILMEIAYLLSYKQLIESKDYFSNLLSKLELYNFKVNDADLEKLVSSVNMERLYNFPMKLTTNDIEMVYKDIFSRVKGRIS